MIIEPQVWAAIVLYFDSIIAVLVTNSWYQNMAERLLVNGAGLSSAGQMRLHHHRRAGPPEPPGQLAIEECAARALLFIRP